MEESNVNNLNGVPNFGHGLPVDGVVEAGVTDVPQEVETDEIPAVEEEVVTKKPIADSAEAVEPE